MKQVKFSDDFYKHLANAIREGMDDVVYDDEEKGNPDTFHVDGYAVDVTVYYGWELHDDSFDHAFGTWHDPYPCMKAEYIDDIDDVTVSIEETDEQVDGFDYDAFMAQFEEPSFIISHHDKVNKYYRNVKVNSGDKVLCFGREATFLAINKENGKFKIKTDKGIVYTESKYMRLISA